MLNIFKQKVSDIGSIRKLARFLFLMGDDVRPIVQKPIVEKFIGKTIHKSVLDAGCGRGLYTRVLINHAQEVAALDYSKDSIDSLKRRLGHLPHLSLYVGSATDLPFSDKKFNLVLHCEVLEHIEDDRKVLSELFRVLQPGGRLIISVPVPPAPIYDAEHVREGYTLAEISQLLQQAGFITLRHQYCMFNFSKQVFSLEHWWRRNIKLPIPSFFILPVFLERVSPPSVSENNLPYDVVIEAKKPELVQL
jgi:SAM-dependent methyltransferase